MNNLEEYSNVMIRFLGSLLISKYVTSQETFFFSFFLRIFRLSLTAFFSGLNFTVASHDLHQAGSWPAGVLVQCLYLKVASPVYFDGFFHFSPVPVLFTV